MHTPFLPRFAVCFCLALICLYLAGCGSTTMVPLRYATVSPVAGGCELSLAVPAFKDQRGEVYGIGRTQDGRVYYPDRLVEEWVTQAFKAELASLGCRVHEQPSQSEPPGFAVRGEIEAVSLEQLSRLEYRAALDLTIHIVQDGRTIHSEGFKAGLERTVFPREGVPRRLMQETLQDLMRVLVPKVLKVCRQAS